VPNSSAEMRVKGERTALGTVRRLFILNRR
jgi:hypothetical protein